MQRLDKALLVVSFGTTHAETRRRTIDAIEADLAAAFPDRRLYRGWTSGFIVKRMRGRGVEIETVEEALQRMQEDGIRDLLVQPTHMIPGAENDRMLSALAGCADRFGQIRVGQPLLESAEDREQLAKILEEEYKPGQETALLLMGHGSAKKADSNCLYAEMELAFRRIRCGNAFVATVEGVPRLEDVMREIPGDIRKVILAPLMIVAGDHAKNDMTGPGNDSWQSRLQTAGFEVETVLRGLGEYTGVQEMLVQHARMAKRIK